MGIEIIMERIEVLQILVFFLFGLVIVLMLNRKQSITLRNRALTAQQEINMLLEDRIKDTQNGVMDHGEQLLYLDAKIFELNQSAIADRLKAHMQCEVSMLRYDRLEKEIEAMKGKLELMEPASDSVNVLQQAIDRLSDNYPIKE